MILYIDSVFAEGRERNTTPPGVVPETLNRLYLQAMRDHRREAVLAERVGDRWAPVPDWRLDRWIIRFALYLQDRIAMRSGDRLVLWSELRTEWLVADLAAVGMGAVSVVPPLAMSDGEVAAALRDVQPKVAVVSGAMRGRMEAVRREVESLERVFVLDGDAGGDGWERYADALDLGGTLDTPEGAQGFRARARDAAPDQPAARHLAGPYDAVEWTQGGVIDGIRQWWLEDAPREGDRVYVAAREVTPGLRGRLYAFLGDGYTTVAFGTEGRELSEIAELEPSKVIAAPDVLAEAVRRGADGADGNDNGMQAWLGRLTPAGRARRDAAGIRRALGGARWVGPTAPLDEQVAGRLRGVATIAAVT